MTRQPEPLTPLRQAVEDAYRFFKAEAPEHWSGDDIGVGRQEWARLTNLPLRALNSADTNHFLSETGHFNRREVRYMLPRLMEVLAEGDVPASVSVTCSLDCLAGAGYPGTWTDTECELVERFFAELLRAYCADPAAFRPSRALAHNIGEYICMVGSAGGDIATVLRALDSVPEAQLVRVLADWIEFGCNVSGYAEVDQPQIWRIQLTDSVCWMDTDYPKPLCDWIAGRAPWKLLADAAARETDPEAWATLTMVAEFCARWPEAPGGPAA